MSACSMHYPGLSCRAALCLGLLIATLAHPLVTAHNPALGWLKLSEGHLRLVPTSGMPQFSVSPAVTLHLHVFCMQVVLCCLLGLLMERPEASKRSCCDGRQKLCM
jgi:hypothetical protein